MIFMDEKLCDACGTCVGVCYADALLISGRKVCLDLGKCVECGDCIAVCPVKAVYDKVQRPREISG